MTEWREVSLGEVCSRVDYGYTASASADPRVPRFLRITDIVGSGIDWSSVPGCLIDKDKLEKFVLSEGDIVVARTGATVGHAKRIRRHPQAVFASYLVRFRPAAHVAPSFLGAVVESQAYREWVLQHAGGAAQPNANAKVLGGFPLLLPDRGTQDRIGEIFDSIDDLIENNRRRVEVLEDIARAIYREWFVHFRYPGHEDATLVDSPLGPIPEGWEIRPLGQVASLDRTSIQPSRSPEETFDHYSIPAFDGGQLPMADDGSMIKSGKFLVSDPAVMVSKLNPRIERTWLVEPESGRRSVASTEFLVLGPTTRLPLEWLYLLARSDIFQDRLRELSGGTSTSHQRAKPHDFLAIDVVAPAEELAADFGSAVEPQLRLARVLRTENRRLASIRDLLLPKLVTGQIDVSLLDLGALADQALGPAQESMCPSGTGWRPI